MATPPESPGSETDGEPREETNPVLVSIGILSWNEEKVIARTLHSLLEQTLFAELEKRGSGCEIVCVINGCTDRTPEIAAQIFSEQSAGCPNRGCFSGRVENLSE